MSMSRPAPSAMLTGDAVYRVVWVPGTDRLRGWCWCGTSYEAEGPVELWQWLLAHPDNHVDGSAGRGSNLPLRPASRLPHRPRDLRGDEPSHERQP